MALDSESASAQREMSAVEAAGYIREGSLKSKDLVQHCLDRIAESDGEIGAWAWVDAEGALHQAEECDRIRWYGYPVGDLHGIPVGIKDIIDTEGMPTECGTPIYKGRIPERDAFIIDRLRDAGAIVLGKTVTTELAFMQPAGTRNPFNSAYSPGGSSSGSAAAVAAGHVPLAIGTQTNGSVVRPASYCNVFGFKPTRGTISRTGILRTSQSLDQVGVFARKLEDAAALVDAIAGCDSADTTTYKKPRPRMLEGCRSDPPIEPNIVWMDPSYHCDLPDEARRAYEDLISIPETRIEKMFVPEGLEKLIDTHKTIQDYEIGRNLQHLTAKNPNKLSRRIRAVIENGLKLEDSEHDFAQTALRGALDYFTKFFRDVDAIAAPASLGPAPLMGEGTGNPICNTIWTLCGLPCISIPVFKSESGLPFGLQLIGGLEEDDRLMRTARWLLGVLSSKDATE